MRELLVERGDPIVRVERPSEVRNEHRPELEPFAWWTVMSRTTSSCSPTSGASPARLGLRHAPDRAHEVTEEKNRFRSQRARA
jgi:hypothetical protein